MNYPSLLILTGLISLCIGSFLNVVIARYPFIINNQWKRLCQDFLKQPQDKKIALHLTHPRSHCPHCQKPLAYRDMIPLISYCCLKGRCRSCKKSITLTYPIIEYLTLFINVSLVALWGVNLHSILAIFLSDLLIVIAMIDLKTQLIPDTLTLPALWLGLLFNTQQLFTSSEKAILGAALGYLLLFLFNRLYTYCRKKEGMGQGDFKMLAMLGAWLGPESIISILLLATFLGIFTSIFAIIFKKMRYQDPIPFGPFLAIAGFISLVTQNALWTYYV